MLRSLLIGLASGARSLTPLAAVAQAAHRGELPNSKLDWLGHPLVNAAANILAAGELAGDKMKSAPDRIVPIGMAVRVITGALAGAALAPRRHARLGAALGAVGAVGAAYVTFHARMAALRRYGQTPTGLVEDALTVAASQMVVGRRR